MTAAPAGPFCAPYAAGEAPGAYLTMLQAPPSPPAVVPVWSPSMQPSMFGQHAACAGPTVATPFDDSSAHAWLPRGFPASAVAGPQGFSTGMYAGPYAPPHPVGCSLAPFGAFAAGLPFSCMHAAAPGMGYCPPLGLSCACMQCQFAPPGAQPWQDQSSGCTSGFGAYTPAQLASGGSSSSLYLPAAPFAATGGSTSAGVGVGSVAAVLAAAAPGEQHLMRTTTLGRTGCTYSPAGAAAGPISTPAHSTPTALAAAPGKTAGLMGIKPSLLQAPSWQPYAGAKGSAQAPAKGSAQMKPPAPRLVKPSTKGPTKAGRARGGGQMDERLHALVRMEGGSKVRNAACTPGVQGVCTPSRTVRRHYFVGCSIAVRA
jgi:hypothetical protein